MDEKIQGKPKYITISYSFSDVKTKEPLGGSDISGPYTFLCGSGDAILGLENRVINMKENEKADFTVPAREAYGEYDLSLTKNIPKHTLPASLQLKKGIHLTINNTSVVVTEIHEDSITVDANHPLAGLDLHFSVTVDAISDIPPSDVVGACGCGNACSCKEE